MVELQTAKPESVGPLHVGLGRVRQEADRRCSIRRRNSESPRAAVLQGLNRPFKIPRRRGQLADGAAVLLRIDEEEWRQRYLHGSRISRWAVTAYPLHWGAWACIARMSLMSPGFRETSDDHEPKPPCPSTAFTH
jgi:hypothetical protein